tara:strand:- start:2333 stop:3499 length:1167 start_codon:yes stop_codon:yes gene_type:complete
MKLIDRAEVGEIVIGRRVQYRRRGDQSIEKASKTFYAQYREDGQLKSKNLCVSTQTEAIELAQQMNQQRSEDPSSSLANPTKHGSQRMTVQDLAIRYIEFSVSKGLAVKSIAKYRTDLEKLTRFCDEEKIRYAAQIDEQVFYRFVSWLREESHKQSADGYAPKTISTASMICVQMVKWGWRQKFIPEYSLGMVRHPVAKPREQPCLSMVEIERAALGMDGIYRDAVLILAYSGLRVNELVQLRWIDVIFREDEAVKLHVRRGGSGDAPKDKEDRFVPIHPRIKPLIQTQLRSGPLVLPGLRDRMLLSKFKQAAKEAGISGRVTVHSLRHSFVSMCAASHVPQRLVLDWVGHSSSSITQLYYHRSERVSEHAMEELAEHTKRVWEGRSR